MEDKFQIITFYEFKDMPAVRPLSELRSLAREVMKRNSIVGTLILAEEGFNSTVAGRTSDIEVFIIEIEQLFETAIQFKSSLHDSLPFKRIDVKVKPEIVTLKKPVDLALGVGTHVSAVEWNELIERNDVLVLDTRNDYEYATGTFERAVNPKTDKFSDLPDFVTEHLDPKIHKKVAMFCTGGIRCEKFAPFMKGLGFEEVYQLEGGILKYLETIPPEEQKWLGECYVFDRRVTVDSKLDKGSITDLSQKADTEQD